MMTTPIPRPPGVPLLGNIFDVNPNNTWASLKKLAEKYGKQTSYADRYSPTCPHCEQLAYQGTNTTYYLTLTPFPLPSPPL